MTHTASHARCAIVEQHVYNTTRVSEQNVTVAENAPQTNRWFVLYALFVQQYANISTDTERRAGLSAIAEPLVCIRWIGDCVYTYLMYQYSCTI